MSLILPRKFPLHERNGNGNGNHHHGAALFPARRILPRRTEAVPTWQSSDLMSVLLSILISVAVLLPFVALVPACRHWFIGPVLVSGILFGIDFVDWLRGRMNLFDPVGILGALGYHAFFIAPLVQVAVNDWGTWAQAPPDWREWLGKMGLVNVAGLAAYAVACRLPAKNTARKPLTTWLIGPNVWAVLIGALLVTAALQAYVYVHVGGIRGYLENFGKESPAGKSPVTGWSWLFSLSESFPRLALMAVVLLLWRRGKLSWRVLVPVFLAYCGLLMVFGGLRGWRSDLVWSLFWGAAVIHFCLRPLSRRVVFWGLGALLGVLIFFAAFRHGGTTDLEKAAGGEPGKVGSSLTRVAVRDLSRSDEQAFLLYRMSCVGTDYKLAWGRTYLDALALLIPEDLWPDRPPSRVQDGTRILWGDDGARIRKASNLYGLAGESMLNFGPASIPVAFGLFAGCIRGVRSYVYRLRRSDGRIFLLPVFLSLCLLGLICDSDTVIRFLFQTGTWIALVLLLTCRPVRSVLQLPGSL